VTIEVLVDPQAHPIIAHRGASGLAPENTVAAFDLAISQGAEAFELDVRLTADGIPVVCHDALLDRTTDATGELVRRRLSDLAGIDAGARFTADGATYPHRGVGVRIPTLRHVLERYPRLPFLIELKVAKAQWAVREDLRRTGAEDRAIVASFSESALGAFREPPFRIGASRAGIVELAVRSALRLAPRDRGYSAYAVPDRYKNRIRVPTARFVAAAKRLGCPVHVWTVNDATLARDLWDRGVAGVITNFPAMMVEARGRS